MSSTTEPNITALASIIAACIAATPPALTAITDTTIKLRVLLQEKQSSPLKVLKIVRTPVDIRNWRKARRKIVLWKILFLTGMLFIFGNTLLYRAGFKYITLSDFGVVGTFLGLKVNVIVVINFIFYCFYFIAFARAYKRMGNNPNDARHFLFRKAFLLVESDYQSTINRCQETLKLLGAKVIEFDSETAIIEAYTNTELVTAFGGLYLIRIGSEDFKPTGTGLEVEFFPYLSDGISKLTKSSNVNRFIKVFTNG
jgi:hypothetical protein